MGSRADKSTLIIGCGNPHRCDDGVGRYVISRLESKLAGNEKIKTLAVHQFDLGLADEIKNWDQVIFVDATLEKLKKGWKRTRLAPEEQKLNFSHHLTPPSLLKLVEAIYKVKPDGWVFSIEGCNFDFGTTLTPKVKGAADKVVDEVLHSV
jgi:hydrogenase maturation protease